MVSWGKLNRKRGEKFGGTKIGHVRDLLLLREGGGG